MRARVFWLVFFRFVVLLFSLATIACHIANLVFLGSRDWWPHYIPYILYIVGPGVSVICAAALNFVSMSAVKSIRGDRSMSVINLGLMVAVIVYNTLKQGIMPWTTNADEPGAPSKVTPGFATYCASYEDAKTVTRCWVSDGLWLGCILVAVFWLMLLVFVFAQNTSDIYDEDDEYEGYDYTKQDVSMGMAKEAYTYHAASTPPAVVDNTPATAYNAGTTGSNNGNADYSRYDSYYDYPPHSPHNAYQGYTNTNYGYAAHNSPGGGNYGVNDTAYMMADQNTDHQYYSPHMKKEQPYQSQTPHAY